MGGPALKPKMHRTPELKSTHESAGCASRYSRRSPARRCPGRRQRGHPPVRRIDDQRRAPSPDGPCSPVHPEIVVAADVGAGLCSPGGLIPQAYIPVNGFLFEVRRFFRGQKLLVRQRFGPLEGRDGAEVPHALQVRRTPRCARWRKLICRGRLGLASNGYRRQQYDSDHGQHRSETSMAHLILLLALSALVRVRP